MVNPHSANSVDSANESALSSADQKTSVRPFAVMMGGQLLSLMGTHLVSFSYAVWVFTRTGSVVDMAVLSVLAILPIVLVSPIAGVIADRARKKLTLFLIDSVLAVVSLWVFFLANMNLLEPWHLYISAACAGLGAGLQRPLFESITPTMVPKDMLVKVNGVVQAVAGLSHLIAPALAGVLVLSIGLVGVLLIDLATFFIGLFCLLSVKIPQAKLKATAEHWLSDIQSGFQYVFDRRGLRALFAFVTVRNFAFAVCQVIALPLALTLTTADKAGILLSLGGVGVIIGGGLMALTGGTRRKIDSIFIAQLVTGVALILAASTVNLWILGVAVALAFIAFPVEESTSTSIMQVGVNERMLGRVSSVRQMMTMMSVPIAMMISAPLAEYVFEPWIHDGAGLLWQWTSGFVGVGEGRGMAVMLLLMGVLLIVITLLARLYRPLVQVEHELGIDRKPVAFRGVPRLGSKA